MNKSTAYTLLTLGLLFVTVGTVVSQKQAGNLGLLILIVAVALLLASLYISTKLKKR
ncbi:MAG: hypothetical protein AVDCRST_MAG56-3457 [uncultured Cytophagales bacterium]|uniref:Uncharacterized protein n=1 Tax=uncultured Cytophagales bacterium TaxID=158755 RepID=A0A6J4JFE0_9SPHI|nr:MAG: hypothetical protein AVDCRST_MAG56-3457 [uncultured Cytophagales bacterium]